jgi:hypothetical protein
MRGRVSVGVGHGLPLQNLSALRTGREHDLIGPDLRGQL